MKVKRLVFFGLQLIIALVTNNVLVLGQDMQNIDQVTLVGNISRAMDDKEELAKLLDYLEDIDQKGRWGLNSLENAIIANNPEAVEMIVKKGANVHKTDKLGFNMLMLASHSNPTNEKVVQVLLKAGAEVNSQSENKETPLIIAADWASDNKEMVKALITAGVDFSMYENQNILMSVPNQEVRDILNNLVLLQKYFNNNTNFETIKAQVDKETIELFILNALNKNPYTIDALANYFKDIRILDILDKYKDYLKPEPYQVFEFIINLRNEALNINSDLLRAIVTGEKSEKFADIPVMKLYKLAQETENKKLGQIIRQWAENAYILSQEMRLKDDKDNEQYRQLPPELVSHITSYLKATD